MTQSNGSMAETAVSQHTLDRICNEVKVTLEQVMGDSSPEMLDEMASIFLEDATPLIDQVKAGLSSEDFTAIQMAAHALKGSSATIGLNRFADACHAIEDGSKATSSELVRQNLAWLESEYALVQRALKTFLL